MEKGFVEIDADRDVETIHDEVIKTFEERGLI